MKYCFNAIYFTRFIVVNSVIVSSIISCNDLYQDFIIMYVWYFVSRNSISVLGAIWPSLSPCTVINPILLTYLLTNTMNDDASTWQCLENFLGILLRKLGRNTGDVCPSIEQTLGLHHTKFCMNHIIKWSFWIMRCGLIIKNFIIKICQCLLITLVIQNYWFIL